MLTTRKSLVLDQSHPTYCLLHERARYKILEGGRGSAKSYSVAEALVRIAAKNPFRILCTREFQSSIKDSVHSLLIHTIYELNLQNVFVITENSIRSTAGAEFIFKGLRHNVQEIKSMFGIMIVWIEEGQNTSKDSLEVLRPTIRDPGSEIWITFNRENDNDPVSLLADTPSTSTLSIIHKHFNYDSNPFFAGTELEAERLALLEMIEETEDDDERAQLQASYDHIWLGMPNKIVNELILAYKCIVQDFPDDLYLKAERLHFGADFGFAADPATLIRSFIYDDCLYIEYEAHGHGIELDEYPEFYDSVPGSRDWPIKADGARPETISHIRNKGFNISAAEKWQGSVEDGITHIKGFRKVIIHPRCKHTIIEKNNYRYKVDRVTKEVLPIIVDKFNHCVAHGTLITTKRGQVPIQLVTAEDSVLTRGGWKKVLWSGQTDSNREVVEIITKTGLRLVVTPDHKILCNSVFIRADEIRYNDEVLIYQETSSWKDQQPFGMMDMNGISTQIAHALQIVTTISTAFLREVQKGYMFMFGKKSTDVQCQKTILSTIKMETLSTTTPIILSVLRQSSTLKNILLKKKLISLEKISRKLMKHQNSGMLLLKVMSGIVSMPSLLQKECVNVKSWLNVLYARKNFLPQSLEPQLSIVDGNVKSKQEMNLELIASFLPASIATKNSSAINIGLEGIVVDHVLCVRAINKKEAQVYDLTVEGQHEFFANGILVHNCWDAVRYSLDGHITRGGELGMWSRLGK